MAEDPEKRFHSIMDKLFHAPNPSSSDPSPSSSSNGGGGGSSGGQASRGKKRANLDSGLALVEPRDGVDAVAGGSRRSLATAAAAGQAAPLCRPWDRGDLMRRLATFKSMTWFGKPKVVSAVNCARRGWVNVDMDIISCEACGARLLFSTPSSWPQQQVDKAALVFSLKLESGHKLLCPWIDNASDERLAEFPPMTPPVLADKFRERVFTLLQLVALPLISSRAIEGMRSPQLEELLGDSSALEKCSQSAEMSQTETLGNELEADSANLYYQAVKLISLCGWEPRSLPYVVDCKDRQNKHPKDADILNPSPLVAVGRNGTNDENVGTCGDSGSSNGPNLDPDATVLDCRLCGASVGLWTFSMVPRPLEWVRLVGYTDITGEKNLGQHPGNENPMDDGGAVTNVASSSIARQSIAGGPPPTKQNFKATISVPVVGRNIRARFSSEFGFTQSPFSNQEDMQSSSVNKILNLEGKNSTDGNAMEKGKSSENNSSASTISASCDQQQTLTTDVVVSEDSTCNIVPIENESSSDIQNALATVPQSQEGIVNREQIAATREVSAYGPGKGSRQLSSHKIMEFDPINQHRHFCPWIASAGGSTPGWRQTLCALQRRKDQSHLSPHSSSPSSVIKVDDPIASVRKLFMTSPTKKMKLTDESR